MSGWENVVQNDGVSIAVAGIAVVFGVLTVISSFIALLPRVLALLPESGSVVNQRSIDSAGGESGSRRAASRDAAVAAAAGFAFHLEANSVGEKKVS